LQRSQPRIELLLGKLGLQKSQTAIPQ
jgi:hypothetical protein